MQQEQLLVIAADCCRAHCGITRHTSQLQKASILQYDVEDFRDTIIFGTYNQSDGKAFWYGEYCGNVIYNLF
jgi:hypothetical protein